MLLALLIALAAAPESEIASDFFRDSRYEQAREHYLLALEEEPDEPKLVLGLARSEAALGYATDALEHYRAYLALNPGTKRAREVRQIIASLEWKARCCEAKPDLVEAKKRDEPTVLARPWFWAIVTGVAVLAGTGVFLSLANQNEGTRVLGPLPGPPPLPPQTGP